MQIFSKKSNFLTPYKLLLLLLQNQKISKQKYKDYDINEKEVLNSTKLGIYLNSVLRIFLLLNTSTFQKFVWNSVTLAVMRAYIYTNGSRRPQERM
jgi:hypothetical protein